MKRADPNRSSTRSIGYAALLSRFGGPDLGLVHASCVSAAGGMVERQSPDGSVRAEYPRRYDHGDSTLDHLVFALKYDGIDLRVLRAVREMPDRRERLFIQCVVQNKGRLSKGKRLLFAELPEEELARMESAVRDAFALDDPATG